jgi:4-amino-4-deoxy-L-arabinose transferase-like glycosyltransferase
VNLEPAAVEVPHHQRLHDGVRAGQTHRVDEQDGDLLHWQSSRGWLLRGGASAYPALLTMSEQSFATSARSSWTARIFVATLLLGLAMVFVGFRAQSLVDRTFDPYYFGEMGKSLARGDGFLPFGTLIKRRAPLYPLLIGALYAAFGERPLLVQLVQCLLLAGTCLLVFDLGRRLFNERTGAIAGLLCALHPLTIRYVADLHLETLLTFLFTLMVWGTHRFLTRPSLANGALVGAAAALTSLTKAVAVLYPGLFAAGLILAAWRQRRRGQPAAVPWASFAVMFAVMAALIAPWTIRNHRVTGHFVPISSGASDAFLRGYVFSRPEFALLQKQPYVDAENEVNAWFRRLCAEAGTAWEREDYETDQILNRAAKAKLRAEPAAFVRKFAVGLFTFWYEMTSRANSLVVGLAALAAWGFALIGWRRARAEGRPAWLLLLPVLYLNLFLAALLALGRYQAPILPALLVLAAFGVDALLSKRDAARA